MTGVLADETFINLAGPENAEGTVSVVFGHQVYETDHPGIQKYMEVMEAYDTEVSNYSLYGYIMAELTVEGLERAGPNLTVDTLIDALEAIKGYQCSVCMAPVSFSPTDHRPIEIEVYMSVQDARARDVRDGGRVRVYNDLDSFIVMVKVAPAVRPGQLILYHAWENYQFAQGKGFQNLIPCPLNPVELSGGQFHLRPMLICLQPSHTDRDTHVEVQAV